MKNNKYNDDFVRTKETVETENLDLEEESDASDFEINTDNNFFNNLSSNSNLLKRKSKLISQISDESSALKQLTLEEKIQKISKKKNKRLAYAKALTPILNKEIADEESEKNVQIDSKIKKIKKAKKTDAKASQNEVKLESTVPKEKKSTEATISFQKLNLIKPLLKACDDLGYVNPTIIQKLAIPPILLGKDVLASSLTGSGKTAAFLLPILQKYYKTSLANYSKVLIIIPTRELAAQCYEMLQELNTYTKISSCLIIGAVPIAKQEAELRRYPDIIIATPGRLIDLIKNSQNVDLDNLEILVFDEADKLLELGFEAEISEIVRNASSERQTLLFSATLTSDVTKLAKLTLKKPIRIQANPDHTTSENLQQEVLKLKNMDENYREACLLLIASELYNKKVIIFFKTKRKCHRMAILFGLHNISSCELHGNLSQTQRIQAFQDFKNGKYEFLLATDLAARGLDVKEVQTVINYELPIELKRYIHRIGRTARAGQSGRSVTLCNEFEMKKFKKMVKTCKEKYEKLKMEEKKIKKCMNVIYDMEEDFQKILKEESLEKELRKADMETKKIENFLKYREEIYNRPRREWIQTERDKQQTLQEEKQLLGLAEMDDYKVFEENTFNRKRIKRK